MIKPIKDLGQNFLRNDEAIQNIVNLLEISNGDKVLEIGPGEGVLTKICLKNPAEFQLIALDIDPRSVEELNRISDPRLVIKLGNFLEQKIPATKILGAIPYNITSPIFHKIIEYETLPKKVVLVIQKEVAEKVSDKKGSYLKDYLNFYYEIEYKFKINREDFYPAPKVDSAVIVLNLKSETPSFDKNKLSSFLHKVFRSPRKKINKVFSKELLKNLNIDDNKRPEDLTLKELEILFNFELK
jgi:16S rRNA (adenine1518-N6/adenine1519-N6)-dimethyltransferase